MAFPAELRNTAVFLGVGDHPNDPDAKFGGTGFLMQLEQDGEAFNYLVTAHHVERQINCHAGKYPIARMNDERGDAYSVSLAGVRWYEHPTDRGVDVAVCSLTPPHPGMPSIGRGVCITPDKIGTTRDDFVGRRGIFGIGDEVNIVGLFRFAYSKHVNVPIVRTGNLAMIPPERVPAEEPYRDMEAYLVEIRSLGGLSGSPVFISHTFAMALTPDPETGAERRAGMRGGYGFLGLVHAHWDIKESQLNSAAPEVDQKKGVNIGVAIVVPAHKILEVLDSEELVERRREEVTLAKKRAH